MLQAEPKASSFLQSLPRSGIAGEAGIQSHGWFVPHVLKLKLCAIHSHPCDWILASMPV